jgi:hypothetical protein
MTQTKQPPENPGRFKSDFDAFRQRQRNFQINAEVPHCVFNADATPWPAPLSIMPCV